MAIVTLPSNFVFGAGCGMGQRRFDLLSSSDTTGADQVRMFGPPRWTMALVQPEKVSLAEAGVWQSVLMQLRGRVNVLAAWDPHRPAPQGTMRGAPSLAAAASAGDSALSVATSASVTLLAGDLLQVGGGLGTSQLVMVIADSRADAGGILALETEPPLRLGYAAGTVVRWDKPLCYYRAQADATTWRYANRGLMATGMALDLVETWS